MLDPREDVGKTLAVFLFHAMGACIYLRLSSILSSCLTLFSNIDQVHTDFVGMLTDILRIS